MTYQFRPDLTDYVQFILPIKEHLEKDTIRKLSLTDVCREALDRLYNIVLSNKTKVGIGTDEKGKCVLSSETYCDWKYRGNVWETTCGKTFYFIEAWNDGTPADCPYCGRPILRKNE